MTVAWRRRARPLLGTLVEIAVRCDSDAALSDLVGPAFARVRHFHDAMSFHQVTSDVRAIAAAAAGSTLSVSADTHAVIAIAQALERASGGLFNVAIAGRLVERGLLPWPSDGSAAAAASPMPTRSALASLRLERGTAVTVLAPVWIDLGGIAKGAAVDAAIEALRAAGAAEAIVNAGGDLAVLGPVPQPITVRGPDGTRIAVGALADGAIATSGPCAAIDGGALVAPEKTRALWADRAVSVIAPRCVLADALTKVVALVGPAAGSLLDRHRARALSVDAQGRVEHIGPDGHRAASGPLDSVRMGLPVHAQVHP